MGTMATGRASDTSLDKPLSDEGRKILNSVKRYPVYDMDANEVLLQMTTEENRIKAKPTRSEKNWQLLEILRRVQKPMKSSRKHSKRFTSTSQT